MEWLLNLIKQLIKDRFTGRLEINFSNGGICGADKVPAKEHMKP